MTRWPASKNERSSMTMRTACGVILGFVAVVLALHGRVQAQAPRADQPTTKVELLFVQNATSGSFDGKTLTLKGVGPTLYFSDRPERITGQLRTSEFVGHWTKGADSFATNPPNATLSVFGAKEVSSTVVVLTNPKLDRQHALLHGQDSRGQASRFLQRVFAVHRHPRAVEDGRHGDGGRGISRIPGRATGGEGSCPRRRAGCPAPAPAAHPAPAPATTLTASQAAAVAKLKELKSLLSQGLISQAQYDADSKKLVDQIIQ